ncbi:MAG: ABC transporter permease [Streptosporangiaceae bacterium]
MLHDGSAVTASALRVAALTRHNLLLRRRDPANLITYVITPMVLIALFKPVLTRLMPDGGTAQDVTGMLVLSSTLALQLVGMSLLSERTWRTWEMLRATPASAAELLIGKAVPVLAVLLLQQTVVIGYGVAVAGLRMTGPPFLLLLAMLVWSMTLLAAGSLLATLVRSHSQLAVLTDIGAIVLSTLAGALLPLSMMPSIARHLAPASPGYWAISMLKAALRGNTAATLRPAAILGAITIVAGTLACQRLRSGLAQLKS